MQVWSLGEVCVRGLFGAGVGGWERAPQAGLKDTRISLLRLCSLQHLQPYSLQKKMAVPSLMKRIISLEQKTYRLRF